MPSPPTRAAAWRTWLRVDLRWLLLAALLVGTVLKVLVAFSPALGRLNSDQAVLYLTARHVSSGELPSWFWGQEYGGSVLQLVLGLVFLITGPHLWMLPVAVGLVSSVVPLLTWRIGAALGFPRQGAVAGALVALGPPGWLQFGVASEAFYTLGMCGSLAALLLALDVERLSVQRMGLIGLLVGFALWESPFSLLTTLPVLVVLLPRLRRLPIELLPLALGTFVGGAPVLGAAVRRGTLFPSQFTSSASIGTRVEQAVTGTWSAVFTRFDPSQTPDWLVDRLAVTGLLLAIAVGVVNALRLGTPRGDLATVALLLPVALWVPFAVRAHLPSDSPASRYGLPLLPYLALFVVRWMTTTARTAAAVGALGLFSVMGLYQATQGFTLGRHVLHNESYARLASELESRGRHEVWGDYWLAYRLAAETDERIIAEPPSMPRQPAYGLAASQAPETTVVVFAGLANDIALEKRFGGEVGVERVQVAQFAVYYADHQVQLSGFQGTADIDQP